MDILMKSTLEIKICGNYVSISRLDFMKMSIFDEDFDFLTKISIFDEDFDFLTKISIFDQNIFFPAKISILTQNVIF